MKFEDCASRVLPALQIARLFDALDRLEQFAGIRELTALCEPQGLPANQAAD